MLISYYANKKSSPRLLSWQPSLIFFNIPIESGSIIKPCTLKHFQVPYRLHKAGYWTNAFSVLLDICVGNSPVTGEFPTQRPVTRSFDVFFDLRLNKRLSKQSWGWWFETPWRPLWRDSNVLFSEVICQRRSGSTSAQVMACCLTVPSHHLNQYWLIIKTVLWHLSVANFTKDTSAVSH